MIKSSAKLWLGLGVLSFCVSSAAARAQQQGPFIGMIQGLDLSPMNAGALPCKDVTKNNCGNLNKLGTVRADAITPGLSSRISKQIHAAVDAFVEKAASQGKQTGVQQLVGTYDKLLGDSQAIALRALTAIRPLLWSSL
jgi:predicted metalloendopeptidase